MSKPREWWIGKNQRAYSSTQEFVPCETVTRVIEKSAYDQLKAESEKLAEALEFYAVMRHPVYQDTAHKALEAYLKFTGEK